MPPGHPVELGGLYFPTKKAAKAAVRAILHMYKHGDRVDDEQHQAILLDILRRHPQAEEKLGCGIVGFHVAKSPDWNTTCFYLEREDGTSAAFSFPEALSPTTPEARLRSACRAAIKDQKLTYRDREWPATDVGERVCPITGQAYSRPQAHVDHEPPATLKALVEVWLAETGLTIDQVPISHTGDERSEDELADADQVASWRAFHTANAKLRMTSKAGNLLQGSRDLNA